MGSVITVGLLNIPSTGVVDLEFMHVLRITYADSIRYNKYIVCIKCTFHQIQQVYFMHLKTFHQIEQAFMGPGPSSGPGPHGDPTPMGSRAWALDFGACSSLTDVLECVSAPAGNFLQHMVRLMFFDFLG